MPHEHKQKPFQLRFGIRARFLSAVIIALLLPTIFLYRITTEEIFTGIVAIEESNVQQSLAQTLTALEREQHQILANVEDYAHWDDMYSPETGRDPEWLRVNITNWIPNQFDIDVIWLADRDGNIYYQYNTPKEFQRDVQDFPLFKKALQGETETHGLVKTSNGVMLAATSPVTTTDFSPPFDPVVDASGVLFYGRFIESDVAERISGLTGRHTEFYDARTLVGSSYASQLQRIGLPIDDLNRQYVASVLSRLKSAAHHEQDLHAIFAPLYDINGDAVLVLSVRHEMPVESLVRENLQRTIFWGVSASAAISLFIVFIFATRLTSFIRKLNASVQAYTRGDVHHPVAVTRTDELGDLQNSFSDLLTKLNQAKVRIQEQEIAMLDIIGAKNQPSVVMTRKPRPRPKSKPKPQA